MSKRKGLLERQIESDLIHNYEFTILDEPKDAFTKVDILHKKCGNILNMSVKNHLKRYCKYCSKKHSKSKEELQTESDLIHNYDFTILEQPKNVKEKINILHKKCGRILNMTINNHINHKNGCKQCTKYASKNNEYWVDKINEIWGDEFILLEEVNNVHTKINVKHKYCGNILTKSMNNLIHGKRGCNICSNTEYGVKLISEYLDSQNIKYVREKQFDDLINPLTNRKLRLDFYIPIYNLAIEIDGVQHYKPIEHWGGEKSFLKLQHRDNLKEQFLKDNNISFIRITNKEINKLEKIINDLICQQ